jgi:hypothetical protein
MLETLRPTLIAISVVCWLSAAVVFALLVRVELAPPLRRALMHFTKAFIGAVVLMQLATLVVGHMGMMLPGWFYALIFVGILSPWVIALGAISLTHSVRSTQQR